MEHAGYPRRLAEVGLALFIDRFGLGIAALRLNGSIAYSGEADHDSGLMAIMIPGSCRSPSERSDAGLFHDRSVIGISQTFLF